MNILLAEEALETGDGHWPSYIGDIAQGFRKQGDTLDVLVHQDASKGVLLGVGGTPWFSKNCWKDNASQGLLGGIKHNISFYNELNDWLQSSGQYDWVCSLTMRLQHLLAYAFLSMRSRKHGSTRFLLLFVQGFSQYSESEQGPVFPNSASTLMARLCFYLMRRSVESGRFVIAAETVKMQEELSTFTGLPVILLPHPIALADSCSERMPVVNADKVTICAPGFARHEKGSDLLSGAITELLDDEALQKVEFVIQWAEPFDCPNGLRCDFPTSLIEHPRVTNLHQPLTGSEYSKMLEAADIVVLPYRKTSYYNRLSRVAIEAASKGIPLVFSSGTWLDEIQELTGAGVAINEETVSAVAEAIKEAVARHEELSRKAITAADSVSQFYSVAEFRKRMSR